MSGARRNRSGSDPRTRALALLSRRPRTIHEIRSTLVREGFAGPEVDAAVDRLAREGLLDDRALAEHFVAVRSERKGHAPARLIRELEARGVDAETAHRAVRAAREAGLLDPAALLRREVERRLARQGGALDRRGWVRMYNALLRLGFEPRDVREALEPHAAGRGDEGEPANGFDDDV